MNTQSPDRSVAAVAMSGGVDSSVAACLEARGGGAVVGFSMQLVDRLAGQTERYGRCCSPEDFHDARQVAERMGFPHYIVDMEREFEEQVLQPFADDYVNGRTPSPCIRCNTFVKFGTLWSRARTVGANRVVTGHYAILEWDPDRERTLLRKAADRDKDQSYFLFDLSEAQRRRACFPLGRLQKEEVRALAREFELENADKPESMDLCFVAQGESYRDVLAARGVVGEGPGEVVDASGSVVGKHDGLDGYTIGQRRGLGVPSQDRLYVIGMSPDRNELQVGSENRLYSDRCVIERTRWIPFKELDGELRADVKIRSSHDGAAATIRPLPNRCAEILFDEPQRAMAAGQAAVAYHDDLVVGGGWIVSADACGVEA
ncbi:MAG: tRNA 2-thiouridine(34) synthase MnmA [Acidobacteriota bacterium]|nr:tRNA 2-thiouridine(34) synthase MnmA [Acidobacteriota bacterium]